MVKNVKKINILTSEVPLKELLKSKDWYNPSKTYFFSSTTNTRTICINANVFLNSRFPDKNINTDAGIKKVLKFILEIVFESCYYGKFNNITIFYKHDFQESELKFVYKQEFSIEINEHFRIYPNLKSSNKREFKRNINTKGWDILKEMDF